MLAVRVLLLATQSAPTSSSPLYAQVVSVNLDLRRNADASSDAEKEAPRLLYSAFLSFSLSL